jgi:hypothetical protein
MVVLTFSTQRCVLFTTALVLGSLIGPLGACSGHGRRLRFLYVGALDSRCSALFVFVVLYTTCNFCTSHLFLSLLWAPWLDPLIL